MRSIEQFVAIRATVLKKKLLYRTTENWREDIKAFMVGLTITKNKRPN